MTLRDLICDLLDCGIDNLDAEVIAFHEDVDNAIMQYVSIKDDFIDVSKNGNCVQIFLHNRPFREVD